MNYETFFKLENAYNKILELENLAKLKRKVLVENYDLPLYYYYKRIYSEEKFTNADKKYIRQMNKWKIILFKI